MHLTSIRPSVSPETIGKVTRLFNGTASDILNELLQNSRRSGATRILIDYEATADGLSVTMRDDGSGIADPAQLVALGSSGWDSQVTSAEDPAGMGVFCLAGKAVTITSRTADQEQGWTISIAEDGWTGERAIAVELANHEVGTSIRFDLPNMAAANLENCIASCAQYYPLPVIANDKELARAEFLKDAIHVSKWRGCDIGVYHSRHGRGEANFHGLVIHRTAPFFTLRESMGYGDYYVRIDIARMQGLELVLPSRKEFVENGIYHELITACERAIYEAIAQKPAHRLSFDQWRRAQELGIDLPEAEAALWSWYPRTAEADNVMADTKQLEAGDLIIVDDFEPEIGQPMARALRHADIRPRLAEAHASYEGYGWYDRLARLSVPRFYIDVADHRYIIGENGTFPPLPHHVEADAIELRYTITDRAGETETHHGLSVDVAFHLDEECWYGDIERVNIAWVKGSSLDPDSLVDLLDAVAFSASDDSDADSWDTQHERFLRDAHTIATHIILGEDAAIERQFVDLLTRAQWMLPKGKVLSIAMSGDALEVSLNSWPEAE